MKVELTDEDRQTMVSAGMGHNDNVFAKRCAAVETIVAAHKHELQKQLAREFQVRLERGMSIIGTDTAVKIVLGELGDIESPSGWEGL